MPAPAKVEASHRTHDRDWEREYLNASRVLIPLGVIGIAASGVVAIIGKGDVCMLSLLLPGMVSLGTALVALDHIHKL